METTVDFCPYMFVDDARKFYVFICWWLVLSCVLGNLTDCAVFHAPFCVVIIEQFCSHKK